MIRKLERIIGTLDHDHQNRIWNFSQLQTDSMFIKRSTAVVTPHSILDASRQKISK